MTDSHWHPDDAAFDADRDDVFRRADEAGISRMMAIDIAPELLDRHASLWGTVGTHPHEASKFGAETIPHLMSAAAHPKVVAVGEIGLDYHYDFAPRELQHTVFIAQMEAARTLKMPIVIHTREAWDDTFALLEEHWRPSGLGGIMHCFSGGVTEARRSLDLGFHLAFGGVITYPKALDVHAAAAFAPDDRILLETDAPYLAPVPRRGKRNEPALMVHTAQRLAELRNSSVESVDALTTANFQRLFALN